MIKKYSIGIDIGGTKIAGCILNENNEILHPIIRPTPHTSGKDVIDQIKHLISEQLVKIRREDFSGVGISTGGDVNHITGEIISATDLIPDWKGTQLGYILREEFKCPVFIENDGCMAVYAEWKLGAAKGYDYAAGLTIGTGLGGGIISESRLLHGSRGGIANFAFLEVPDFIDKSNDKNVLGDNFSPRNLEYYLSGPGLLRIAKILKPDCNYNNPEDIFNFYRNNDSDAKNIMRIFFKYFEYCLRIIQRILSPEIVVIGGGVVTGNYDIMSKEFEKINSSFPFVIKASLLKNQAGMLGAAIYVKEMLRINRDF